MSLDDRTPSNPTSARPLAHPIRAFFAAVALGGFLHVAFVGGIATGRSLYVELAFYLPPLAFLVAAVMSAIALGMALLVVGGLLTWLGKFSFWPFLLGSALLAALVYIGLPLAVNPGTRNDMLGFLGRSALNIAIIVIMVCCFWLVANVRVRQMRLRLSHLCIKGIAGGVLALFVLYALYGYLVVVLMVQLETTALDEFYVIGGYAVYLLAGYCTGLFVRVGALANAIIAGAFTPLAHAGHTFVAWQSWSLVAESLVAQGAYSLVMGAVLCGMGGLIWDAQQQLAQRRANELMLADG